MHARNMVLAVCCGAIGMTVVDLSVVNVALPSIQAALAASPGDLQWVVVAYGVAVAGFLLLGGRIGDLAGHRRVLVAGVCVLMAGSLLAGLASSLELLVAGRAVQGLGAALAAPNALGILTRTFAEGAERNRALGLFGAAGGSSAVLGSVLGGLLVQGPGWPWVFYVNLPLGALLVGAALRLVPADARGDKREPTSAASAVALCGGLVAVALGVHASIEAGWLSWRTLAPVLGGLALLVAFVVAQGRVAAPLVPLVTLRRRSVVAANLTSGLLWASFLALIYQGTLFVQQVLGWSPLAASSSTIPIAVLSLVVSARVAPPVIGRLGPAATVALGLSAMAVGMLLLVRATADATFVGDLLLPYAVIGIGLGLAEVAVQVAAFTGVPGDEAGVAGGAIETSRELGGAIGLALLVSLALAGAGGVTEAFHRSVLGAAVLAGCGVLAALLLLRPAERRATREAGAA